MRPGFQPQRPADPTSVTGTRMASPRNMHAAVRNTDKQDGDGRRLVAGMDVADAARNQTATPNSKQQPAGGDQIAVEAL